MSIVRKFMDAPLLSREDERAMIESWQTKGDVRARDALVLSHGRLAVKFASRRAKVGEAMHDDLVQAGVNGIMKAIDDFDLAYEGRLSTYCFRWIQTHVAQEAAAYVGIVSTPKNHRVRMVSGMKHAVPDEIKIVVSNYAPLDHSFDDMPSLSDVLPSDDPTPYDLAEKSDLDRMHRHVVGESLAFLTERERTIVIQRQMIDEPKTLAELGEEYGITRERVRQIEAVALRKLRTKLSSRSPTVLASLSA